MSKKAYYKCEECGISYQSEKLVLNDDLELICYDCVQEGKTNKRVRNLILLTCAFLASSFGFWIYKLFTS